MKSTTDFIITPKGGSNFVNEKEFNGKTFVVNTSIEEAINVNRIGIVLELPLNYNGNIQMNDEVVVQHNVFRDWFDSKGITRKSNSHFKDDLFLVGIENIFLIYRNGEFISVDGNCFIEPITEEVRWIGTQEIQHQGTVFFRNKYLEQQGVFKGDTIAFSTDSEYEFQIYDKKLYRIRTENILVKISA